MSGDLCVCVLDAWISSKNLRGWMGGTGRGPGGIGASVTPRGLSREGWGTFLPSGVRVNPRLGTFRGRDAVLTCRPIVGVFKNPCGKSGCVSKQD